MILRAIGEMFGTIYSWILRRCIECLLIAFLVVFVGMITGAIDSDDITDDKGSVLYQLTEEK